MIVKRENEAMRDYNLTGEVLKEVRFNKDMR